MHEDLVAALLGGSGGAAAALSLTATGVVGTAGLGKTTAATCLAHDARVHARFPDGIVWLVFGQERDALSNLRKLGRCLGLRREQWNEWSDIDEANDELTPLLKDKRVVIVLDDVWEYPRQVKPFKDLLMRSRGGGGAQGSKLLLTTRVCKVAEAAGGLTELSQCNEAVGLRILAKYMGTPSAQLSGDADARRLVKMSGGLPIMLEQWGVACRRQSVASLIVELNKAKAGMEVLVVDAAGDYEYGNFFAGLEAQLARLEGNEKEEELEMVRCYCMLAVFMEDDRVPIDVARQLWAAGLEIMMGETIATQVARRLAGDQLLKLEEGESGMCLSLLDLHRQYLVHRSRSDLASWHASLLRRCGQTCIGDENQHGEGAYWRSKEGQRRFVHHLCAADFGVGGGAELLTPMESYGDLAAVLEELNLGSAGGIGPDGAKAIAPLCAVTGSLTSLSTAYNNISGDGAQQLAAAVLAKPTLSVFSGIPLKELRTDSLTSLDIQGKGLGVPEAMVLADLLQSVSASLNSVH